MKKRHDFLKDMSLNKILLIGNAGRTPDIRAVGDTKVASFTLATTERYRGKDGNVREETEWHNIAVWGKLADVVEKYVDKGTQLYVEGRIKTEKYTDAQGVEKYAVKVIASSLQLLGKKEGGSAPAAQQTTQRTTPIVDGVVEPDDSDPPF